MNQNQSPHRHTQLCTNVPQDLWERRRNQKGLPQVGRKVTVPSDLHTQRRHTCPRDLHVLARMRGCPDRRFTLPGA